MQIDQQTAKQTRKIVAMTIFSLAVIISLVSCHAPAWADVFEDGEYWISGYTAEPLDIQPVAVSLELEINGNSWNETGSVFFPPNIIPFTSNITVNSITPLADGYYSILGSRNATIGTQSFIEPFDATPAVTPSLICEVTPIVSDESLDMVIIMPKADNPVAADLGGHWKHFSFGTGTEEGNMFAEASIADIELDATLGTGTHQNPGDTPDPFAWSVDSAAATVTVDLGQYSYSFDIGTGQGGLMMRSGMQIGESDPDELSVDLFVKTGSGRDAQEAVGRYAVQSLVSNDDLSEWNTYKGILSINADGNFHIDFEADAMLHEPAGWTADGTWTMDDTGYISFFDPEGGDPVVGQLSLTGDVIVAVDTVESSGDECSLIVATHVVPEPGVMVLLIWGVGFLLLARRK